MWALGALGAVSGVVGAYGRHEARIESGRAQAESLRMKALIASNNARISEHNAWVSETKADLTETRGRREVRRYKRRMDRLAGQQTAAYGSSGAAIGGGTVLDVLTDTARTSAAGMMDIKRDTAMKAWGFRTDAENYRQEARFLRMQSALYRKHARRAKNSSSKLAAIGMFSEGGQSVLNAFGQAQG